MMFLPGCKPPFRLGQKVSGSVEHYSWHHPPIWLLLYTGCSELVHQILPPHLLDNPDPHFEAALELWREGYPHPPPIHPASCAQRKWDAPRIEATFSSLLESENQLSQARLLAVSCPESGAWLNALPLSSMGLRMDDVVIRIAVGLRLGLPLCHPHECSNCGSQIEELGTHGFELLFQQGPSFSTCIAQ